MKSGTCPKCSSTEIYTKRNGIQSDIAFRFAYLALRAPYLDAYICMSCGYFEQYIADVAELHDDIKQDWKKVE